MIDAAIQALTDGLLDAIDLGRWDDADAELETLAQEVADAIARDRLDDLAVLARWTVRSHTILALRDDPGPDAMHRLGQLRAIALMIAAARSRTHPRPAAALATDGTPAAALLAGLKATARTGEALSVATGLKPEVVARALPELRAAGLVRSWPAGRLVVNALTEDGRRLTHADRSPPPERS